MKKYTIYDLFPDYDPNYPRREYEPSDPVALKKFEEFFGKDFDGFVDPDEELEEEKKPLKSKKVKSKIKRLNRTIEPFNCFISYLRLTKD